MSNMPSTQVIALWVEENHQDIVWTSIDTVLFSIISSKLNNHAKEEIWDFIGNSRHHVIELLRNNIEKALSDGAVNNLEIDEESPPYIRYCGNSDNSLIDKLKRINPYDFEKICAKILERIGCKSEVTPKGRDGGIDFIATGLDILPQEVNCPLYCKAAVIGQAKRYNSKFIAEKALREFVGASLVQRHDLRITKKIGPLSPVLLAFWTTSSFDPSGREFARKAGVWLMDGHTICDVITKLDLVEWVEKLPDEEKQD